MSQYTFEEDNLSEEYSDEEAHFGPSDAQIAGQIDEDGHLQAEDLYGVQTKIFNITINGSLEQIAGNNKLTTWRLSDDMQKQLKQVISSTNRSKAGDEHLAGDLSKAVLLQATILQERSDFPIPIGVKIPGLVPQVYTNNSRYNWVIDKDTRTNTINQSIFEPDNVFTKYMYEKLQKLDMETLNQQVDFEKDPSGKFAMVDTNGFVWDVIMRNAAQGKFRGAEDHLFGIDEQVANSQYSFGAKVPMEIARSVYDAIKEPLQNIEKSFVDMRKLCARFERADGEHWNSFGGLIGEAAGLDKDSEGYIKEHKINTPYSASLKVLIKYIVY